MGCVPEIERKPILFTPWRAGRHGRTRLAGRWRARGRCGRSGPSRGADRGRSCRALAGVASARASVAACERSSLRRASGPDHLIGGGAYPPRRPDHGVARFPRPPGMTAKPGIIGEIVAVVAACRPLRSRLRTGAPGDDLRQRAGGLGRGPERCRLPDLAPSARARDLGPVAAVARSIAGAVVGARAQTEPTPQPPAERAPPLLGIPSRRVRPGDMIVRRRAAARRGGRGLGKARGSCRPVSRAIVGQVHHLIREPGSVTLRQGQALAAGAWFEAARSTMQDRRRGSIIARSPGRVNAAAEAPLPAGGIRRPARSGSMTDERPNAGL